MIELKLVDQEYVGVKFPYDPDIIDKIRELDNRRWNAAHKQWEVHIVNLPEIIKIFYLHPGDIDHEIMELYQKKWTGATIHFKVDNVTSSLNSSSFPIDKIDELTSFHVMGAEYNPKYIEGTWDGRRHLFNKKNHSFPTGLVPRIIASLKKDNIQCRLKDSRIVPSPLLELDSPTQTIRHYQETAILKALEYKRGILEMATGSGKTLVAASIISKLNLPTLFFVHTRELLYQTMEVFKKSFHIPIGQIGDSKIQIEPITVATIQTVIRALGNKYQAYDEEDEDDPTQVGAYKEDIVRLLETVPVVFFDECHHLPADSCYTVAMRTQGAYYRYGLSATPYRADKQDLLIEAALGPKIIKINASTLIDQKHLVPPRIIFIPITGDNYTSKDYAQIYQTHIVQNPYRNGVIAKQSQDYARQGKTVLILVQQVKHGEELVKIIPGSQFLQGTDPTSKRNSILKDFKEQRLKILVATTLADEGLDIPSLGSVILAGGGKSETRALQRVGRALRPAEEKTEAIVVDFIDQVPYLEEHSQRRLDIFKTEPRFTIQIANPESPTLRSSKKLK